mmetsp:Transcript_52048/g.160344  ORF Transcript_52048/g.160344 Transcript_52048/m.160344 type:complete len:217 (-) Transcript_52048:59-709(-)
MRLHRSQRVTPGHARPAFACDVAAAGAVRTRWLSCGRSISASAGSSTSCRRLLNQYSMRSVTRSCAVACGCGSKAPASFALEPAGIRSSDFRTQFCSASVRSANMGTSDACSSGLRSRVTPRRALRITRPPTLSSCAARRSTSRRIASFSRRARSASARMSASAACRFARACRTADARSNGREASTARRYSVIGARAIASGYAAAASPLASTVIGM